jgi:2'-hydroxyisoflavone reductase
VNVLVLGGTRFVGRHIVEEFLRHGHRIVCFHRGESVCALPAGAQERYGDRNADLSAVDTERWDAVVDTSAFRPEHLHRSLRLRTRRYLFISTLNVYRDLSLPGVTEEAETIETFDSSDEAQSYGGNKAACERLVMERYPGAAIIFRPGVIAGKWDNSGRFTYWCVRYLRGGRVLAPGEPQRLVQFIDAADLARFAERLLSRDRTGVFNIVGPQTPVTMAQLLDVAALTAAEYGAPPASVVWADAEFLLEHHVEPWLELPLWLTEPEYAGILEVSNAKAIAAGLRTRRIGETMKSVLEWAIAEPGYKVAGLSAHREAELLEDLSR